MQKNTAESELYHSWRHSPASNINHCTRIIATTSSCNTRAFKRCEPPPKLTTTYQQHASCNALLSVANWCRLAVTRRRHIAQSQTNSNTPCSTAREVLKSNWPFSVPNGSHSLKKFHKHLSVTLWVMLQTDRQTNRETGVLTRPQMKWCKLETKMEWHCYSCDRRLH